MYELELAAELINRALEALSVASARNPDLRGDFGKRSDHLRDLLRQIEGRSYSGTGARYL